MENIDFCMKTNVVFHFCTKSDFEDGSNLQNK